MSSLKWIGYFPSRPSLLNTVSHYILYYNDRIDHFPTTKGLVQGNSSYWHNTICSIYKLGRKMSGHCLDMVWHMRTTQFLSSYRNIHIYLKLLSTICIVSACKYTAKLLACPLNASTSSKLLALSMAYTMRKPSPVLMYWSLIALWYGEWRIYQFYLLNSIQYYSTMLCTQVITYIPLGQLCPVYPTERKATTLLTHLKC